MSSVPNPAVAGPSPFVSTTTPSIERANRLMSLKAHPGFLDVLRISQDLVDTTTAQLVDFGGWDDKQITVLKVRAQAAKEHHALLIFKIQEAIQSGLDEMKSLINDLPVKSAEEIVDQGDYVRQQVLQKFDEQDMRAAGSY